jgi:hypothetical protein
MGLSFTIAAGFRQRSHSRARISRDWWLYFTVSDSRHPQAEGPGPRIYVPQEQGGPVLPPGTGFSFRRLLLNLLLQTVLLVTSRHWPHRKQPDSNSKSVVAFAFVSAETCLPSRCSETVVVYPPVSQPLHGNVCTRYNIIKWYFNNGLYYEQKSAIFCDVTSCNMAVQRKIMCPSLCWSVSQASSHKGVNGGLENCFWITYGGSMFLVNVAERLLYNSSTSQRVAAFILTTVRTSDVSCSQRLTSHGSHKVTILNINLEWEEI